MMTQKLLIGGLALAIIAVIGFGVIDAGRGTSDPEPVMLATPIMPTSTPAPLAIATELPASEATTDLATTEITAEPGPIVQAKGSMGDTWQASGVITSLEDYGFTFITADGSYYVELGPPTYWQAQGITLLEGDVVSVDGYYNGDQVHARVVNIGGAELVIRSEAGQPMWSGGVNNGTDHTTTGTTNQVQVSPEDWLTVTGIIGSVTNGNVTLNVDDGTVLALQMGQPQFWQSQGISLQAGDPVEVLGFWSGDQFMAGDIRKTTTGETIMLRDPNGRQLWGGPGRNGNQGNTGQSNGTPSSTGQGNGNQGNGYRGGQGN